MGTCYLHIGPSKTASTYLQASISRNLELLEAEGISVPRLGKIATDRVTESHHNLAFELSRHRKFDDDGATFQDLKSFLVSHEPAHVLLSSECFENIRKKAEKFAFLKDFFGSLGYDVCVLGMVRPQVDLINSNYAGQIKRFAHKKSFPEFVESILSSPPPKYDMNDNFKYWLMHFPCEFIPLNDDVMEMGLDRVFFQKLGFPQDRLGQIEPVLMTNKSPGPKTIEAAKLIRGELEGKCGGNLREKSFPGAVTLRKTLARKSDRAGWNETGFYGFDDQLFERVVAQFSESNDRFSRKIFGLPWSEVFQERQRPMNVFCPEAAVKREQKQFAKIVKEVLCSIN